MNLIYITKKLLPRNSFLFRTTHWVYHKYRGLKLQNRSAEDVFDEIYTKNLWGDPSSKSGPGSNMTQTHKIRLDIPALFHQYKIKSVLDIPCGDFHWMQHVMPDDVNYVGADIVHSLVESNRKKHQKDSITFVQMNLISDRMPQVDLIFVRDCLVHLSNCDVMTALQNIIQSGSRFLLATTFPDCPGNRDIVTGQFRPVNLTLSPFNLPQPLKIIDEACSEPIQYTKSLGLWDIAKIKV